MKIVGKECIISIYYDHGKTADPLAISISRVDENKRQLSFDILLEDDEFEKIIFDKDYHRKFQLMVERELYPERTEYIN